VSVSYHLLEYLINTNINFAKQKHRVNSGVLFCQLFTPLLNAKESKIFFIAMPELAIE